MSDPESLASIGQIACQQVGGDDGLASAGGKLHHYSRFFRIEDFLDLFEQIALVVTKFNHLPSTGTSAPTERIYPALSS